MGSYLVSDGHTGRTSQESKEAFRRNLILTVQQIQKEGSEVWIVKSPPEYPFNVPRRLARTVIAGGDASKVGQRLSTYTESQSHIAPVFEELKKYNVHFIDPSNYLCADGDFCRTESQGHSLYTDSHHLSTFGELKMQNLFNAVFSRMSAKT